MLEKRKKQFHILEMTATLFVGVAVVLFSFPLVSPNFAWAEEAEEENEVDEEEVEEVEDEIDDVEDELQQQEQRKLRISNELGAINRNINVVQSEINKTEAEIERIDGEIKTLEEDIEDKKESLAATIRKINQLDIEVQLIMMEGGHELGEYFVLKDSLDTLEEQLFLTVQEIQGKKNEFEGKKEEQEKVSEMREDQRKSLAYEKSRKGSELNSTQADIDKLNAKINKLRSELSSLLGKGYDTDDIKDAAKFAAKVTGVRKDFIMGMLVVESDLGRYTGGCNYKESRMSDYRKDIFKKICKELDYNYKKMKVSCPPSGYSGTGGAMGVAQFMSDTWWGYKSSIAAATGHNPPDPWSLVDGVTAMALKLAKVSGVTSHKESAECKAAKLYLSGTTSSKYDWYCEKVLYWADNYKKVL